jgi:tetratricopeptide (TPR) repeat protein
MPNIRQLFSRQGIDQGLLSLHSRSPQSTLILASIVAGSGYMLLGLVPLLTLIGVFKVLGGFASANSISAWLHLFIWLLITAACALISFTLVRVKINKPNGLGLKADKAPRLYELLAELGEDYKLPRIDRLVIHEQFTLEFIPVPRFGLPFFTTNVLYIGLPILQGLSPAEFRGALARVLGQSSGEQSKKTHWIYRWHQYAQQYSRAYRRHKAPIYKPLQWFYKFYTPVLQYVSAGVLRADELEGDIYMLQVMNDREAADVIIRYEVSQAFLKNKYWPKIFAMLRKNPGNPEHTPHVNMAKVLRNALTENEFAQTMKELINQETSWQDTRPTLHARLENIGQRKLDMPPPVMETAAQRYLGDAFGAVLKLMDKQWLAKYSKLAHKSKKNSEAKTASAKKTKSVNTPVTTRVQSPVAATTEPQQHTDTANAITHESLPNITSEDGSTITVADRRRLAELKQKSEETDLNDNEAWELAYLTEKLEDKSLSITLYQQVLKKNPNHAKTLFAVGRILITRNDASGVKVLERAMELDKGCIAQGCWMLAKYYKATGDEARSKEYLERAANISFAAA